MGYGRARELATAACYDCHSNQTRWPPRRYVLAHPDAALSEAERQGLIEALEAMDRTRGGDEDRSGPGDGSGWSAG